MRRSGGSQRELSAEDDGGAAEKVEVGEKEGGRSSEAVDGQEGAGACFAMDEDYDTELEPEGYVARVLIKSESESESVGDLCYDRWCQKAKGPESVWLVLHGEIKRPNSHESYF